VTIAANTAAADPSGADPGALRHGHVSAVADQLPNRSVNRWLPLMKILISADGAICAACRYSMHGSGKSGHQLEGSGMAWRES
jgi:hypothetical protein